MDKNTPKIIITADPHFGQTKLIEFGRPKNFEEKIYKGLEVVRDIDILIVLGDFCNGNDAEHHEEFMERVKGKKILVRGNHDNKSDSWYYKHGWGFVCTSFTNNLFGFEIEFSHRPSPYKTDCKYNIHGHTHGNSHRDEEVKDFYDKKRHIEIALENTDYQPVFLTQKFFSKKLLTL